ncbi:metallophosphoesterase [Halosquirtibacter laminarini]|uniref:Metallophosphoesterase n=1 Tax=Halosquirtibacter laminarini TaxID=3374600 RepID=A0AC61NQ29_9BACT|nr:metallophosphoesterase [Prolixibacteraceae bacterium]
MFAKEKFIFKDSTFRVLQLTDLHIDAKNPNQDSYFNKLLTIIKASRPQLLFFTGDIVTGQENTLDGWKQLLAFLEETQIPYTMVLGNHDPEVAKKNEIYELLKRGKYAQYNYIEAYKEQPLCYVIPIYDKKRIVWNLWGFDSGSMSTDKRIKGYAWVSQKTIFDINDMYQQLHPNEQDHLDDLAFQHIPVPEYSIATKRKYRDFHIVGHCKEKVCSPQINSGLFYCLWKKHFKGIFVGHDHNNDYVSQLYGLPLIYGRCSGDKTCYGKLRMGARVIELHKDRTYKTWVIDDQLKRSEIIQLPKN